MRGRVWCECFLNSIGRCVCVRPAVAGVAGLVAGDLDSGRGRDEELSLGSDALNSRCAGRRFGCIGSFRTESVPEDCGLVREAVRADFGRDSVGVLPFVGTLDILPTSFALLVLVDPGVVVWLRTIFCCVWLASEITSP